jgi:hypothetical protein
MEIIQQEVQTIEVGYEPAIKIQGETLFLVKNNEKKYVLSKYNPQKEANRLVDKQEATKETLWIVLGFCLGYTLKEIFKKVGKDAKILVIEPNEEVLETQLEKTKNEVWKQYPNLVFFSGTNFTELGKKYLSILAYSSCYNMNVISEETYSTYYVKYYTQVMGSIGEQRAKVVINQNTLEDIIKREVVNTVKNRRKLAGRYNFSHHKNKYKDIPALVVSAGPSLEKNIHLIKDFKGIIICGSRSLEAILKQGVNPDFVTVIDSKESMYYTFKGNTKTDIPLIVQPGVSNRILEEHQGPQYFVSNEKDLMEGLTGVEIEGLQLGGSVATLCLSAAEYMGCSPVVLIGQDLAYTNDKRYSSDCANNKGENKVNSEFSLMRKIKEYYGGEVYSDYMMLIFLRWIEEFIQKKKHTIYINSTEGGAYIRGAEHISFKEVLEQYASIEKPNIEHALASVEEDELAKIEKNIKVTLNDIQSLNEYSVKGSRLSSTLLDEYTMYKGVREHKIQKLLSKLEEIDTSINQLEKASLANIIFSTIYQRFQMDTSYHEQIQENDIKKGKRIATFSRDIYEAMKSESDMWIKVIKEALN